MPPRKSPAGPAPPRRPVRAPRRPSSSLADQNANASGGSADEHGDRGRAAGRSEDEGRSTVRENEATEIEGGTARLVLERGQTNHCLPGVRRFVVGESGQVIPGTEVDQGGLLELGCRRRPGRRFQIEGVIPDSGNQGES